VRNTSWVQRDADGVDVADGSTRKSLSMVTETANPASRLASAVLVPASLATEAHAFTRGRVRHGERAAACAWAAVAAALAGVVMAVAAHVRGAPAEPAGHVAAVPARWG
jgi:uncharacterized membrane protein